MNSFSEISFSDNSFLRNRGLGSRFDVFAKRCFHMHSGTRAAYVALLWNVVSNCISYHGHSFPRRMHTFWLLRPQLVAFAWGDACAAAESQEKTPPCESQRVFNSDGRIPNAGSSRHGGGDEHRVSVDVVQNLQLRR